MKKIVAVNTSPRTTWNTAALVREAAKGAEAQGAEIVYFDLYKLEKYQGCVSCFGCKTAPNEGVCICRDGLKPVLDAIREADGLIIGSPNYLGNVTAGFRALYERLVFQSITYQVERRSYNERKIPVLFIMTSNAKEEFYDQIGYTQMIEGYKNNFEVFVGPTKTLISANTLQVSDYSKYNWTMFDPEEKKKRHGTVFQNEKLNAFELGAEMVRG
ncbi:MAG: flavodoxin family protein [Lachnospiraceae bacterium]|nr:flavodoxin family protein [Lachnospiraceae bacterium]MBQ6855583.1 flavodoxin family protein [Lachnospiraceae bacterium]